MTADEHLRLLALQALVRDLTEQDEAEETEPQWPVCSGSFIYYLDY